MTAKNYDEIRTCVERDGGLYLTTMAELRDIRGAGRLSTGICEAISGELAAHGLGHLPAELPTYQEERVRIYRLGSMIANVASAVLNPSSAGDRTLRTLIQDEDREVLKKIRELVCES